MASEPEAYVVSIEVDGRQSYIFETDRLREMLGASRLIQETVDKAKEYFKDEGLYLFQPVSGEIRVWADVDDKTKLLDATWQLRSWLAKQGIEHSCGWMKVKQHHFTGTNDQPTDLNRRSDEEPKIPSLSSVQGAMTAQVGRWKGRKPGVDAGPTCSLFAPCQIHGHDFATEWRSGLDKDEQDERRNLRGRRAKAKFEAWKAAKRDEKFFDKQLFDPARLITEEIRKRTSKEPERPVTFANLVETISELEAGDQFIAFICADGDRLGRLLSSINWNATTLNTSGGAWKVNREFVAALDDCMQRAYGEAVNAVLGAAFLDEAVRLYEKGETPILPILPQLLGGDDLWTLCRKDIALPFCCSFAAAFTEEIRLSPIITQVVGTTSYKLEDLTISMGVAFAKAGHPAHAMIEAAESLLRSAKERRKDLQSQKDAPSTLTPEQAAARVAMLQNGPPKAEGCIDWHWIDSSLAQAVAEARREGWEYEAEGLAHKHKLASRPWTISQCRAYLDAAEAFHNGIDTSQPDGSTKKTSVPKTSVSRRKREQLEAILRRGGELTLLGWEAWLKSLTSDEIEVLRKVIEAVENAGAKLAMMPDATGVDFQAPWFETPNVSERTTPFLDLLALGDVMAATEEEDDA